MPWLFLSDPDDYPFQKLFERKHDVWDGINGTLAQKYLREVRKGDRIIGYHTAPEKQVVCELKAESDPYQNPKMPDKKNVVIDVRAVRWLKRPIPLSELRAHPVLGDMKLFQLVRPIAVSPLTDTELATIEKLSESNG